MNKTLIAAALCSLMAAPSLALASGDLIVNGSFEATAQGNGSWDIYPTIMGWVTVGGSGIEVRNNVAGTAFDGNNFVELDGWSGQGNTTMLQSVQTSAGQVYDLSFAYSPRPGVAKTSNKIEVLWNGGLLAGLTSSGGSAHNWNEVSLSVIGTGGMDKLTFRAIGTNDGLGGSLDAVSLTAAVPEPGTYALMAAGLLALGFIARRRKAD